MDYDLALKLKNKGFPQKVQGSFLGRTSDKQVFDKDGNELQMTEYVYAPTLSELIEACGDSFPMLSKGNNLIGWECTSYNSDKDIWETYSQGKTPEIAVANLWLALQDNK